MSAASTPYDAVPYASTPLAQTHPDRLHAVATLSGVAAADPSGCRLLEIGCADGANLIAMAVSLPGSTFVGVDASGEAIERARALAGLAGVDNVRFERAAASEAPAGDGGPYDYVVCHGVFSWVRRTEQEAILRLCRERLGPGGVAYLNTNARAGWRARLALRDLLRLHTAGFRDPAARIGEARALLEALTHELGPEPYGRELAECVGELAGVSDAFLFHEYLEGENEPLGVGELCGRLTAAGLAYLGEAGYEDTRLTLFPERCGPGVRRGAPEFVLRLEREDLVSGRTYRASLACRPQDALAAPARSVAGFHAACRVAGRSGRPLRSLIPDPFDFATDGARRVTVADPLVKAAVVALDAVWPRSLPVADLGAAAAERLAAEGADEGLDAQARLEAGLVELFGAGVLRLSARRAPVTSEVAVRPVAFAAARALATRGPLAANALHQAVALEPVDQVLLPALDGTRDSAALVQHLVAATLDDRLALSVEGAPERDADRLVVLYGELLGARLASYGQRGLLVEA